MKLEDVHSPGQLKNQPVRELEELAEDIRRFLIASISKTGGHLSSNLGAVELSIALHAVFDSPEDKIIFDVGHQSYTHKLLTGRKERFDTLRSQGGLSGYQKRKESAHDPWEAGHSSTSLSAGLGLAAARDLLGKDFEVISVIGDGAIGGGMALEALSDIGAQQRKMIILFNDNEMSISPNRSGLERSITRLRTSPVYRGTKKDLASTLSETKLGTKILSHLKDTKNALKQTILDDPLFSQFGVDYIGPVDGHSLPDLIRALQTAKEHDGPVVVHVLTTKGKGYPFAQNDPLGKWHGVGPFEIETGQPKAKTKPGILSWSEVICRTLLRLASNDPRLCVITPAMATGSALHPFEAAFPKRFFDCGIAEEHAVTMAAGMAQGGLHPFVSIYSSFLQRAFDQVLHDVARMQLPVVFGIDRAGLVGEDGETHQGIYDPAFLKSVPGVILAQPKDAAEAQNLLYSAFLEKKPYFIRYPRGKTAFTPVHHLQYIPAGRWETFEIGTPEAIVIAYGPDVDAIIERARRQNRSLLVVNARFLIPVDEALFEKLLGTDLPIFVLETDLKDHTLADSLALLCVKYRRSFETLAPKDGYIEQATIAQQRKDQGVSIDALFERIDRYAA